MVAAAVVRRRNMMSGSRLWRRHAMSDDMTAFGFVEHMKRKYDARWIG
jgi:hypothetical protein